MVLVMEPLSAESVADLRVRYLGGVTHPVCDSCRGRIAVLQVRAGDDTFLVCWDCRP